MRQFLTSGLIGHRAFRLRGAVFLSIMLLTAAISCNKSPHGLRSQAAFPELLQGSLLDSIKHYLRDSLSPAAFDSLEFSKVIVDTAGNGNLFLRFPSLGDPITRRFIVVEASPGLLPLKAVGVRINHNRVNIVGSLWLELYGQL